MNGQHNKKEGILFRHLLFLFSFSAATLLRAGSEGERGKHTQKG